MPKCTCLVLEALRSTSAIAIFSICLYSCASPLQKPEKQIQIRLDGENFLTNINYEKYLKPETTRLKKYIDLTAEEAKLKTAAFIKSQEIYFLSNIEPYSGQDSVPVKCRLANLPKGLSNENEIEIIDQRNLFSSRYFQLGCSTREPVHTQTLFVYCKKNKILYSFFTLLLDSKDWLSELLVHCP